MCRWVREYVLEWQRGTPVFTGTLGGCIERYRGIERVEGVALAALPVQFCKGAFELQLIGADKSPALWIPEFHGLGERNKCRLPEIVKRNAVASLERLVPAIGTLQRVTLNRRPEGQDVRVTGLYRRRDLVCLRALHDKWFSLHRCTSCGKI